jgi:hypothetical protein
MRAAPVSGKNMSTIWRVCDAVAHADNFSAILQELIAFGRRGA